MGLTSVSFGFFGCFTFIILLHFGLRPYNKICKLVLTKSTSSITDYTIEVKLSDQ